MGYIIHLNMKHLMKQNYLLVKILILQGQNKKQHTQWTPRIEFENHWFSVYAQHPAVFLVLCCSLCAVKYNHQCYLLTCHAIFVLQKIYDGCKTKEKDHCLRGCNGTCRESPGQNSRTRSQVHKLL